MVEKKKTPRQREMELIKRKKAKERVLQAIAKRKRESELEVGKVNWKQGSSQTKLDYKCNLGSR